MILVRIDEEERTNMKVRNLIPDCGELEPDAYDAEGNLTINSWELFKQEELAREEDEEDA